MIPEAADLQPLVVVLLRQSEGVAPIAGVGEELDFRQPLPCRPAGPPVVGLRRAPAGRVRVGAAQLVLQRVEVLQRALDGEPQLAGVRFDPETGHRVPPSEHPCDDGAIDQGVRAVAAGPDGPPPERLDLDVEISRERGVGDHGGPVVPIAEPRREVLADAMEGDPRVGALQQLAVEILGQQDRAQHRQRELRRDHPRHAHPVQLVGDAAARVDDRRGVRAVARGEADERGSEAPLRLRDGSSACASWSPVATTRWSRRPGRWSDNPKRTSSRSLTGAPCARMWTWV